MTQREKEIEDRRKSTKPMQNINTTMQTIKSLFSNTVQTGFSPRCPSLTGGWIPEHCAQGQLQEGTAMNNEVIED
jgi:hypothetical protein